MCAKYPTGPHTISLDKPVELWSAIGTMVAIALPALILCFFNYMTTRIISSILQLLRFQYGHYWHLSHSLWKTIGLALPLLYLQF